MKTIKQRIEEARGEYTRLRRKKFEYLKHIGQAISRKRAKIFRVPVPDPTRLVKATWWRRFMWWIKKLIKGRL